MVMARHVIRDYQARNPHEVGKVIGQYVLLGPRPNRSNQRPAEDRWPQDVLPLLGATYLQPTYEHDRDQSFDPAALGDAPEDLAIFAIDWNGLDRPAPPTLKLSLRDFSRGERLAAIGYHSVSLRRQDDLPLNEHTEMDYDRRLVTSTGTVREVFEQARTGCGERPDEPRLLTTVSTKQRRIKAMGRHHYGPDRNHGMSSPRPPGSDRGDDGRCRRERPGRSDAIW